ncbi:MAG: hypothetical protein NUV31_02705 [Dehalococcoidales bacterium]|jgi:hypothetical protein|nr:hypothetical protein [Dehalococcoidales bacterium]
MDATRKSITLTLNETELMELERILLDNDREGALQFIKQFLEKEVKALIAGQGH